MKSQSSHRYTNFIDNFEWASKKIQPLAKKLFYQKTWPNCEIISLDDHKDKLRIILDVAGADKLLKHKDGRISFLAQRFRRWTQRKYDDFTIRVAVPSGNITEFDKIIKATERKTLLCSYYAYGLVNYKETGFLRFRIIDLVEFMRMLKNKEIQSGKFGKNTDGTEFLWWSFNILPKKIILYEYLQEEQLQLFK